MPTAHHFESTADAYDWSNVGETPDGVKINDGDVLVVASEKVVGILHRAWPIAVTEDHGSFHILADGADWSCVGAQEEKTMETTIHPEGADPYPHVEVFAADPGTDYTESVDLARKIISSFDPPVPHPGDTIQTVATYETGTVESVSPFGPAINVKFADGTYCNLSPDEYVILDRATADLTVALDGFKAATANLDRVWSSAPYTGDEVANYPTFLPSFDEFAALVTVMEVRTR